MPHILSVDAVKSFHARALHEHGGLEGMRSADLLESSVFQPQQSAGGEDAYESLAAKAAAYGFFRRPKINPSSMETNVRPQQPCSLFWISMAWH
jgi:hypothetical protein